MIKQYKILICCISLFFFTSCFKFKYVDENRFIGTWEVKGKSIYEGMKFKITKDDSSLKGYIITPPKNKYAYFIDSGDNWITSITRVSNYSFKITEKKIAQQLFSEYKLDSNSTFYAYFFGNDTISLSPKKLYAPKKTQTYYLRVK